MALSTLSRFVAGPRPGRERRLPLTRPDIRFSKRADRAVSAVSTGAHADRWRQPFPSNSKTKAPEAVCKRCGRTLSEPNSVDVRGLMRIL